jgi:hypothetical protein
MSEILKIARTRKNTSSHDTVWHGRARGKGPGVA